MKTILVPIDFSDASYNAASYAASLANIFSADLILTYAYLNSSVMVQMTPPLLMQRGIELRREKESLLNEYAEILRKKYTVRIRGVIVENTPAAAIQEVAKKENADIIVMGMKGEGKSRSVLGSTALIVSRRSLIPVLIIPEKARFQNIRTITLASDFDAETEMSNYTLLNKIAKKSNAFLQILNIRKDTATLSLDEIYGKLNTALAFPDLKFKFYTIEDDDVDDGIEDFLEDHPSEMLVMVSRKHNLFHRMFGTIHTKEMSYETEIPLLILQDK